MQSYQESDGVFRDACVTLDAGLLRLATVHVMNDDVFPTPLGVPHFHGTDVLRRNPFFPVVCICVVCGEDVFSQVCRGREC